MTSSLSFFGTLNWIDGRPLVIEPYRQEIFRRALDTYRDDGVPQYTLVLAGRGKKNHKSIDLILAALFVLMCRESVQGSDALLIANDETQAAQDLDLAKKLIAANPDIAEELVVLADEIRRKDGRGTMHVIPAGNVVGQHGKTAAFLGFDEIHGLKDHAIFEALAPDPTRYCLTWITSYDTIMDTEGVPMHDFKKIGIAGTDSRMLFSWYSADYCTDQNFANLPPDERANPSMGSWPEGKGYIEQQRRRLPSARFRRLHHNLPGAPQGAFFDQGIVERAIVARRQSIEPQDGIDYLAFVDMSGGSNDDATLGIAHWDGQKAILDLLVNQGDAVPFNPRWAVARFVTHCRRYRCREVFGDSYAGETFRRDFSDLGIDYRVEKRTRTDIYESLEVALNGGQVELLDIAKLRREILTIVRRGASLDHPAGGHDDWATSAAGALLLVNPDLGNASPNILEFYRRQAEAAVAAQAAPPTLQQEHAHQAVMQIGPRRQTHYVKVQVPTDASHIYAVSGTAYMVEIENEQRFCWMAPDDARELISSALNLSFFEANRELRERLGRPPAQPRGIRVVDYLDHVESMRPRSLFDRGGAINDTLREMGKL